MTHTCSLKKGVIRNSLSNPNKAKQTLERLNFETLYFFNPLPHMPILGFSNSAANKDMMSKIWTIGIQLSN